MRKFENFNPTILFIYYVSAIIPFMVIMDPLLSAAALLAGLVRIGIRERRIPVRRIVLALAVTAVMTVMNALISHNGTVELFFINGRAITLEAVRYGAVTGLMMSAAIVWFSALSNAVTGEKIMIMLRRMPKTALMISMVMRLIPRYVKRYRKTETAIRINEASADTGRTAGMLRISSAVFTWALENSMDTADVMIMRGFDSGIRRVSGQSLHRRDVILAAVLLALQFMWLAPEGCRIYIHIIYFIIPELYLVKENVKWKIYTLKTSNIRKS